MKINHLEMYQGCLIVIDMVNGFVREGVLHDPEIGKIIPRQIEIIKEFESKGKPIIFFKDTHSKDSVEFERFGGQPHCLKGTNESQLVDELKEHENYYNAISIEKNSTNIMESLEFRELMDHCAHLNEFDIIGCCTDICIANGCIGLANYLDERNRKHTIRVHEDGIATYNEKERKEYVEAAKLLMKQQGIELIKK